MKLSKRPTLIEALGARPTFEQIGKHLAKSPTNIGELRKLDAQTRIRELQENDVDSIVPGPEAIEFVDCVHATVRRGYRGKDLLLKAPQKPLYDPGWIKQVDPEDAIALIGPTGMGKSHAAIGAQTSFPKFIDHSAFGDGCVRLIQFPVIVVTTPPGTASADLPDQCCIAIAEHYLNCFGEELKRPKRRPNRRDAEHELAALSTSFAIGIFLLDNFERQLNNAATMTDSRARLLINNALSLRAKTKVPIGFIGNYPIVELLRADGRTIRRVQKGGTIFIDRPKSDKDEMFTMILDKKWSAMLLQRPGLPGPFKKMMFDLTGGISDYLSTILKFSQIAALRENKEELTAPLIESVYKNDCRLLHGPVEAMRSGDRASIDLYTDLRDSCSYPRR